MEKPQSLQENLRSFEKKQIGVSILGLIILLGLSVIANRLFKVAAAEQTAKLITRLVDIGESREVILTLQDAKIDYFSKVQNKSKDPNRSFTFPPLAEYTNQKSPLEVLTTEAITIHPQSFITSDNGDVLLFEYNRFSFVEYALGIWIILNLVSIPQTRFMKRRIVQQVQKDLELQKKSIEADISRKVRHNINAPLSALMTMTERLGVLHKNDQELFQSIIHQIRCLVKDLHMAEKSSDGAVSQDEVLLEQPISQILSESLLENQLAFQKQNPISYEIDSTLMSANVRLAPHELRSILSNLIQNAVDASSPENEIHIAALDLSNEVRITVKDNGKGIPSEYLDKVTKKNFSLGKANGAGLGLYHAQTLITEWNGTLVIESKVGMGTTVVITLPIESRAKWYIPRIKIRSEQSLIILDDQKTQYLQWEIILNENDFSGKRHFFFTAEDFLNFKDIYLSTKDLSQYVFLFDNQLGTDLKGVNLLRDLSNAPFRYLITNDAEDADLQNTCADDGIYLISKMDLHKMPIVIINSQQ